MQILKQNLLAWLGTKNKPSWLSIFGRLTRLYKKHFSFSVYPHCWVLVLTTCLLRSNNSEPVSFLPTEQRWSTSLAYTSVAGMTGRFSSRGLGTDSNSSYILRISYRFLQPHLDPVYTWFSKCVLGDRITR